LRKNMTVAIKLFICGEQKTTVFERVRTTNGSAFVLGVRLGNDLACEAAERQERETVWSSAVMAVLMMVDDD